MNSDDLDRRLLEYLNGELAPDEAERLRSYLEAHPRQAARLVDLSDEELLFRQGLREFEAAQPRRKDPWHARPRWVAEQRPSFWVWTLGAASVLAAIVLLFASSSGGPGRGGGRDSRPVDFADRPKEAAGVEDPKPERAPRPPERPGTPRREGAAPEKTPETAAPLPRPEGETPVSDPAERKRRIEEEMRAAIEGERKRGEPTKPADPSPSLIPTRQATVAAVGRIERAEGDAVLLTVAGKKALQVGQEVLAGQGLETSGQNGAAVLRFSDGSRIELRGDTGVRDVIGEDPAGRGALGKRITVARGRVEAQVVRQPKDRPMTVSTAYGEATVLGTTLRIAVDADPKVGLRLEVLDGRVRLRSLLDRKVVEVESGHFAVAAAGVELVAKPIPIDEILLLPKDAQVVGKEWTVVADAGASTGSALEAKRLMPINEPLDQWVPKFVGRFAAGIRNRTLASYVDFSFTVTGGRDYHVWIRACATSEPPQPLADPTCFDQFAVEFVGGRFTRPSIWREFDSLPARPIQGHGTRAGYWWVGGNADKDANGNELDPAPVTVRFPTSGRQKLRVYAENALIRVDAIWLSATQNTRPADDQRGPETPKK